MPTTLVPYLTLISPNPPPLHVLIPPAGVLMCDCACSRCSLCQKHAHDPRQSSERARTYYTHRTSRLFYGWHVADTFFGCGGAADPEPVLLSRLTLAYLNGLDGCPASSLTGGGGGVRVPQSFDQLRKLFECVGRCAAAVPRARTWCPYGNPLAPCETTC